MKKLFFSFLFVAFAVIPYGLKAQNIEKQKDSNVAFVKAVDKFMEVSGAKTTVKTQFPLVMNSLRRVLKGVPDEIIAKIEDKAQVIFVKKAVEFYAPFYERYYTLEEIKKLIVFYETDLGRKVARTAPLIMKDVYQAGEQLGRLVRQEIIEELKAEGYDMNKL